MVSFNYKSTSKRSLSLADKYYDLAGEYLRDYIDKLISLSLFSLGFISLFVRNADIKESVFLGYLFVLGILSLILSILLGLYYKYNINNFLNNVGDAYYDRHIKIESLILKNNSEFGAVPLEKTIKNLPKFLMVIHRGGINCK